MVPLPNPTNNKLYGEDVLISIHPALAIFAAGGDSNHCSFPPLNERSHSQHFVLGSGLCGCSITTVGHKLILSFLFWTQLQSCEFHRCMLFIKKKKLQGKWMELGLGTICFIEQSESSLIISGAGQSSSKH